MLFGYLAALTSIELVTGILILPQRQTALVAKQAAEVDVLTGGRLRLGVGIGWNHVEYEALGENFRNRGRRIEEQIDADAPAVDGGARRLRRAVPHVAQAGINPLPVQRPIPVWMGGGAEPVLRRIARLADGWFPQFRPGPMRRRRSSGCAATSATPGASRRTSASKAASACSTRRKPTGGRARRLARPRRDACRDQHDERRPRVAAGAHRRDPAVQGCRGVGGVRRGSALFEVEAEIFDYGVREELAAHFGDLRFGGGAVGRVDLDLHVLACPNRLHLGESERLEAAADRQSLRVVHCRLQGHIDACEVHRRSIPEITPPVVGVAAGRREREFGLHQRRLRASASVAGRDSSRSAEARWYARLAGPAGNTRESQAASPVDCSTRIASI